MYINDLEEELILNGFEGVDIGLLRLFLLLYADDIVILSQTPYDLQKGLDILYEFCNKWKLKVNEDKTKVIIFRKGGFLPRDLVFSYNGKPLEIVNRFCYLGVVFTSGGSFSEAQKTLASQAQKAAFKLKGYLFKFIDISTHHLLELFDKLISPIINYSGEIWGFCQASQIERVHLQFCKSILNVKVTTQNDFIYGELGRINYQSRRLFQIIKYWIKILNGSRRKYTSAVYKMMLNDIEARPNKINWAALVRNTLYELGFNEIWLSQTVGDHVLFLSILKQRLCDTFIQNWNARLTDSSRAIFYRNFNTFGFKQYLNIINIPKYRYALTRLRVASHRLQIEVGRWHRPVSVPINERKCLYCQKLEDEFHFLFECNLYNNIRKKFIPTYYYTRPNMYKLIEYLSSDNPKLVKNLASFVYNAFKIHKQRAQRAQPASTVNE
jgi:hypothetical protein